MARSARKDIVDPDKVQVFHCVSRCVRRAFLCGVDPYSGMNYDHRRKWIEEMTIELAGGKSDMHTFSCRRGLRWGRPRSKVSDNGAMRWLNRHNAVIGAPAIRQYQTIGAVETHRERRCDMKSVLSKALYAKSCARSIAQSRQSRGR